MPEPERATDPSNAPLSHRQLPSRRWMASARVRVNGRLLHFAGAGESREEASERGRAGVAKHLAEKPAAMRQRTRDELARSQHRG